MTSADDNSLERSKAAEDLLFSCFEDEDVEAAVDRTCSDHPELAKKIRKVYRRLSKFGLTPSQEGRVALGPETRDGPKQIGPYEIGERLGEGGMGVVYRGWNAPLGREVAVKLVRPELVHFAGKRARFEREVEAIARLAHPNIVPILEVGESDGMPWFAMEYVRGANLAEILQRVRGHKAVEPDGRALCTAIETLGTSVAPTETQTLDPLFRRPWNEICTDLVAQVASALEHAHGRGVLHRDIKPSNIMVTAHGRAMLLDFGLARTDEDQVLTRSMSELGSLPYMAPELIRGDAIPNPRLDIYGLGVTLFEMLSLENPFLDETAEQTRQRVLAGRPARLRRSQAQIPWDLETVCLTAMAPESERRYPNASAFLTDLDRLQAKLPIRARRPGVLLRVRRWQQRHPVLAAGLVTTLAATAIATSILFIRERRARDTAEEQERTAVEQRQRTERILDGTRLSFARTLILAGNPRDARIALSRIEPGARKWVWRHLELMTDMSERRFDIYPNDAAYRCAVSPDGRHFATVSADADSYLVEVATGRKTRLAIDARRSASFSLDGKRLAVASKDGRIHIFDVATGVQEMRFDADQASFEPTFGAEARTLVSATQTGEIRVWDIEGQDGPAVLRTWKAHELPRKRDRLRIAFGGKQRTVLISHDRLKTAKSWTIDGDLIATFGKGPSQIQALATTADASVAVIAHHSYFTAKSRRIIAWDTRTGKALWEFEPDTRGEVLAIEPTGRSFAYGTQSFQVATMKAREALGRYFGHTGGATDMFWLENDKILTAARDGTCRLWNMRRRQHRNSYGAHSSSVTALRVLPDSKRIVSGGSNGSLALADPRTGEVATQLELGPARIASIVDIGENLIAVACEDESVRIVALPSREDSATTVDAMREVERIRLDANPVSVARVEPRRLVVVLASGSLAEIRLAESTGVARPASRVAPLQLDPARLQGVEWQSIAASNEITVLGAKDGRVAILATAALGPASPTTPIVDLQLEGNVLLLAVSKDSRRVFAAVEEGPLFLLDAKTGDVLRRYSGHGARPSGIAITADTDRLLSTAWNATFYAWHPDLEDSILFTSAARTMHLCLDLSPDEEFAAVGGLDGAVHLLWAVDRPR